jgi:thiosulfate/3-mercaptopyruvate sulfurtransferase
MTTEARQDEYEGGTKVGALVEPQWLEEHLHDPQLRLVEVDVSPAAYENGHIEGAVFWNVYRDLKDSDYHLIDKAATERLFARSGIGPDSVVVLYGYAPAMGFWLLKLYGHSNARILNCARSAWQHEGRAWNADSVNPTATAYPLPDQEDRIRANRSMVEDAIDSSTCTIVDVRTDAEYRGERFWPSGAAEPGGRAGHVPSAVNISIEGLYDQQGSFRPVTELSRVFSPIELSANGDVISYCTIGGRASTAWFVLTYLIGRDRVRVYDGSWAEWGCSEDTPVAHT